MVSRGQAKEDKMSKDPLIPSKLLDAIMQARQVRQLDESYSNGATPYSQTWDLLSTLIEGVEDDQTVQDLIQHFRITGEIP